nr:hypothetical protein [Tanacetum cinerariifolium]
MGSCYFDQEMEEADFDLKSTLDDEIMSVLGSEAEEVDSDRELSVANKIGADKVIDTLVSIGNKEGTDLTIFATFDPTVSSLYASSSALTTSQGDVQALIAKVVWEKKEQPSKNDSSCSGTWCFIKLRRVLTPKQLKAQEEDSAAIEAKRVKMIDEYNHYINFRDDIIPITKFSYNVNNVSKEATMRITKNNKPLSLKIYDIFILKMLEFSLCIELHALASTRQSASNDPLLKNLKRENEFHLDTTTQLIGIQNAIKIDLVEAREIFDKLIYVIEARDDVVEARKILQDNLDDLGSNVLYYE